jgi:transposase-like protein
VLLGQDSADQAFTDFPLSHWKKVWSTNPLERLNKEIKRRTDVVSVFPNPAALLRLAGAVLVDTTTNGRSPSAAISPRAPWPCSPDPTPRPSRWRSGD